MPKLLLFLALVIALLSLWSRVMCCPYCIVWVCENLVIRTKLAERRFEQSLLSRTVMLKDSIVAETQTSSAS